MCREAELLRLRRKKMGGGAGQGQRASGDRVGGWYPRGCHPQLAGGGGCEFLPIAGVGRACARKLSVSVLFISVSLRGLTFHKTEAFNDLMWWASIKKQVTSWVRWKEPGDGRRKLLGFSEVRGGLEGLS